MSKLSVSIVQFSPILFEKTKNQEKIISIIEKDDSDIIVFPELSTSGYFFMNRTEAASMAEAKDSEFNRKIQDLSKQFGKIIVYGFAEYDVEKIYNTAAIVFPDEKLTFYYRKTHLFYRERFCFDEGNSGFLVIEDKERDIRIGAMICYDWRFPEAARTLGLKGADLIVCPSNLVTDVWQKAMPARALENKVYLAVANRCGSECRDGEELLFKGESALYSYNGDLVIKAAQLGEAIIKGEIVPERTRIKAFNDFNDIDKDRRPEYYFR
jgi:predicted amidohydrolase